MSGSRHAMLDTSNGMTGKQHASFSISAHSQGKNHPGACVGRCYGGVRPQATAETPVSVVCPDTRSTEPQCSPVLCWEAGKTAAR